MKCKRSHSVLALYCVVLTVFAALVFPVKIFAVPASPFPFELKQPSGKAFEARKRGDEWHNWVETKDGYGIYKNRDTGNWEYYVPSDETPKKEQKFRIGRKQDAKKHAIVSEVDPAKLGIPKGLRPPRPSEPKPFNLKPKTPHPSPLPQGERESSLPQKSRLGEAERTQQENENDGFASLNPSYRLGETVDSPLKRLRRERSVERGAGGVLDHPKKQSPYSPFAKGDLNGFPPTEKATSTAVSGTMHLLVIGVDYDDCPATYSAEDIQPLVFGSSNSVADYYNDVSYGAVTIEPATESNGTANDGFIGWLRLEGNHPNPGSSIDSTIAKNAILAADPYINYAQYDKDSDGYVEPTELSIIVIVAGYEASYGDYSPSVWAHKYYVWASVDGKYVEEYAEFGEKLGDHMATMGTPTHELGHLMFSLPDLYGASDNTGIGYFCLMASGGWGAKDGEYSGTSPTHLCAWSKEYLGWGTVNTISSSQSISIPKADGNKSSIFRINTSDSYQYFLIENREFTGYDTGFQASTSQQGHGGLVIYHIDNSLATSEYDWYNWYSDNKCVDVEEANEGSLGYSMLDTDTDSADTNMFFFSGNNASFTDTSTPDSKLKNGISTNISITDISTYGETMSATIVRPPTAATTFATDITSDSATLNGTANAYGQETTVWFEYGTATGFYNSKTSSQTVSGTSDAAINTSISGLSAGTTYYFRLAAQNSIGTVYGSEYSFTFTTATVKPYIGNGSGHTILLKSDGTVWGWADNYSGQLGDGTHAERPTPVQAIVSGIIYIATGTGHSLALKPDGTVWAWGSSYNGKLGDGTIASGKSNPAQVKNIDNVISVDGGLHHTIALKSNGTVWIWGSNGDGRLADVSFNDGNNILFPVQIGNLNNIMEVSSGYLHNIVLKSDGTVWAWGWNESGQLGNGIIEDKITQTPTQVNNLSDVIATSSFLSHNLALKSDGTVWAWGYNKYGALGDGTTENRGTPVQVSGLNNVIAISTGAYHSLALKSDGTVWAWGDNGNGQLGNGETWTDTSTPSQVINLSGIVSIAAGWNSSRALKSDGTVWAWGIVDDAEGWNTYTPRQIEINLGETSSSINPPKGGISINNDDYSTTSTDVTLNLFAIDAFGEVTGYYVSTSSTTPSVSDTGWTSVSSTTFYTGNVSYTLNSDEGTKTVYAWYKDTAGNVSARASDSIILDTTAPAITITSPTSDSSYTTTNSTISLSGSASDGGSGVSSVTWSNSNGGSGTAIGTTDWFIPDIPLAFGENVITVTATDGAGYTGTDTITVNYTTSTMPTPVPEPTLPPLPTPLPTFTQPPQPDNSSRIFGYVVDIKGNPIESVRLKLKNLRTGVKSIITSDADGYFDFGNLDADLYVIVARKKGYKKVTKSVNLEDDMSMEIWITMYKMRKTAKGLEESHSAAAPQPK